MCFIPEQSKGVSEMLPDSCQVLGRTRWLDARQVAFKTPPGSGCTWQKLNLACEVFSFRGSLTFPKFQLVIY